MFPSNFPTVLGSGFSAGDWTIKGLKGPLRQRGVQDAHARGTLAFNGMDFAGRYMNCPEVSTTLCICTYYRRAAARPAAHGGRRNSHVSPCKCVLHWKTACNSYWDRYEELLTCEVDMRRAQGRHVQRIHVLANGGQMLEAGQSRIQAVISYCSHR